MLAEPTLMTSLEAQSQFGRMLDMAIRNPVVITRRGRPIVVAVSYETFEEIQAQLKQLDKLLKQKNPK